IDAHHDMFWAGDDPTAVNIANFIAPALRDELVREVFWVVPDGAWEAKKNRVLVASQLKRMASRYPRASANVRSNEDRLSVGVLGKSVAACPLGRLPRIDETVLLDIDVDYLVIPRVFLGEREERADIPWCWPDEVLRLLASRGVRSDLVTIAYSI